MPRRDLLKAAAGTAALLACPALAQPAGARTLRCVPQADLAVIDPMVTTAYVTRHRAPMVW